MFLPVQPLSQSTMRIVRLALACVVGWIAMTGAKIGVAEAAQQRVITHVVQRKQNLGLIAKRYHTTPKAIRKANRMRPGQKLKIGQRLRIVEVEKHRKWRDYLEKKRGRTKKRKKTAKRQKKTAKRRKKTAKKRKKTAKKRRKTAGRKRPKGKYARRPRRRGRVHVVRHTERFRGQLVNRKGRLVKRAAKRV
ncbi:MAG: LysM domain-containing protein, partial [Polyangiaceae bacterium]